MFTEGERLVAAAKLIIEGFAADEAAVQRCMEQIRTDQIEHNSRCGCGMTVHASAVFHVHDIAVRLALALQPTTGSRCPN